MNSPSAACLSLLFVVIGAPSGRALQTKCYSVSEPQPFVDNLRSHGATSRMLAKVSDGADGTSSSPSTLLRLLSPTSNCKVAQMSSTDLAYIGDVVYELTVRAWAVWPPKRTSDLQSQVVELVRAENQSRLLAELKSDVRFACTDVELQVLSRGRNAVSGSSRNRRNPSAYQDATALEALIGYLYITDHGRCSTLVHWIRDRLDIAGDEHA